MKKDGEKMADLCRRLQYLHETRPANKDELKDWYKRARELERIVAIPDGLAHELPHFVWNYLADADIRFREKDYSDDQNLKMRLVVQCLKRGEIISDEDIEKYSGAR